MNTSSARSTSRPLGTMVAYGFAKGSVLTDLEIARRLGATVLEILPDWPGLPDPREIQRIASDQNFVIHSAHGTWGGTTIAARRVDLASTDSGVASDSVDDLRRCLDWLVEAGGQFLIVHPGGLSNPEDFDTRRLGLIHSLGLLGDHAASLGLRICVENMPSGVHPGSRMADLAAMVNELHHNCVGLAIDTGHANITDTASAETQQAGQLLLSTHVHDNNGRSDTHLVPGQGTVDWPSWSASLRAIDYRGPIMLECIRELRKRPDLINSALFDILGGLTGRNDYDILAPEWKP